MAIAAREGRTLTQSPPRGGTWGVTAPSMTGGRSLSPHKISIVGLSAILRHQRIVMVCRKYPCVWKIDHINLTYMYFLLNMEGVRVLPLCCAYQIQSGFKFILLFLRTEIFRPFFIHAHTFLSTLKNWMLQQIGHVLKEKLSAVNKSLLCQRFLESGEDRKPRSIVDWKPKASEDAVNICIFRFFFMQKCYHHISNKNTGTQKIMINGNI